VARGEAPGTNVRALPARGRAVRIAVSVGCPCGVGPEVSAAASLDPPPGVRVLLVSAFNVIERAARAQKLDPSRFVQVQTPEEAWSLPKASVGVWSPLAARDEPAARFGRPGPGDGAAQLAWVDAACDLAASGRADAMVTGPVAKEVIAGSGAPGAAQFLGHTEHLQRRLHAREVVMAFFSEGFSTSLVTTHLPLAKVPPAITPAAVARSTYWLGWLCAAMKGGRRGVVRLAVCSLNPHAGEGGLLGGEEKRAIAPGIVRAGERVAAASWSRARPAGSLRIEGPIGAETAFRKASQGAYDGVVAMYHDQATIPMKLVAFGESVNVSLGLPIVRTSVDHGTGYDIAGRGLADARGMREAIAVAARLALVARQPSASEKRDAHEPRVSAGERPRTRAIRA
jgi:4-hydroxythreonine-4-phosphate dehydrogenase